MMYKDITFPAAFQEDIQRAVKILKESGCTDIYLFGSISRGKISGSSDIDIAMRGCPQGKFFSLLGKLIMVLNHSIDLVNLDNKDAFSQYLEKEGVLVRIG